MRVSTYTSLTLFEFGEIMGINPWELGQIGDGFPTPNLAQCPYVWFQHPWQEDFLSREELARTIEKAELALAEELSFWPGPRYFSNETALYPRPHQRYLYGLGGNVRNMWKSVQLRWGKVQSGGILARSVVNIAGAVVLSDSDGDSINDTFTVTVATTLTDATEIGIYFVAADRNNAAIDETWRIRPVKVTISGGNAVITGHPAQLVKPDLTTITNPAVLNVTVAANYVTTVEVYRVYTDTTTTTASPNQGLALWEVEPCDTPPCASEYLPLCMGPRNADAGQVWVDWTLGQTQCPPQAREPDRVAVNYVAGEPLVNGRLQRTMAEVVAHLAAAWLPVTKCGCDRSNRILDWWRQLPNQGEQGRPITLNEIDNNPFGVQRGALWAWERVRTLRERRAVSL